MKLIQQNEILIKACTHTIACLVNYTIEAGLTKYNHSQNIKKIKKKGKIHSKTLIIVNKGGLGRLG